MSIDWNHEDAHVYGHVKNAASREEALAYIALHRAEAAEAERGRVVALFIEAWGEDTGGPSPSNVSALLDKLWPGWDLAL